MASQDSSLPPPPQHPHPPPPPPSHSHPSPQPPLHHHHQQQQPPHTFPMGPPQQSDVNPYSSLTTPSTSNNIIPNQQQQQQSQPRFPFSSGVTDEVAAGRGLSSPSTDGPVGYSIETSKKKRGRPRKYSDKARGSSISIGLSPSPVTPVSSSAVVAVKDSGVGGGSGTHTSEKRRGRPPGSVKKQLDALGTSGIGFTPHVITVKAGEDVASKIVAFTQQGPRTVCILSANGSISNVTLRQPASSGGTVTYEGRFEIISLIGSFLFSESNGGWSRSGGLSVSLAGPDGKVLGGGVAGKLVAATPVQVVVGSFLEEGMKPKHVLSTASPAPTTTPNSAPTSNMMSFANQETGASPPPQGASSNSNSSDNDNNNNNQATNGGSYVNSGQPMQNIQMYSNVGWGNSGIKMHPN